MFFFLMPMFAKSTGQPEKITKKIIYTYYSYEELVTLLRAIVDNDMRLVFLNVSSTTEHIRKLGQKPSLTMVHPLNEFILLYQR